MTDGETIQEVVRGRRRSKEDSEKFAASVVVKYGELRSLSKVAAMFHVSSPTVLYYLKKAGVARNPVGRPKTVKQ
jgi:hypothetical protein